MSNDLTIYSNFAHEWWDPHAPHFRTLQNLTPFRLSLIEELIGDLGNKKVADLGCGGGLIAVPLINKGAYVTGIDLSAESIEVAKKASEGKGEFFVGDVCNLSLAAHSFDAVLMVDLLDHIPNYPHALNVAANLLRPGGKLFVGTINRTPLAWISAILLGEGLNFIPKGTHKFDLFIKPHELIKAAEKTGLQLLKLQGEWPLVFSTIKRRAITLRKSNSCAIAYSCAFEKTN